jgi:hypothetical protein
MPAITSPNAPTPLHHHRSCKLLTNNSPNATDDLLHFFRFSGLYLSFQILAHQAEISLQACRLTLSSHHTGAKTMNQNINKTGIPARASLLPRGKGRGLVNLRPAFSHASLASLCVSLAGVADSGDPRRPVAATRAARNPYGCVLGLLPQPMKANHKTW